MINSKQITKLKSKDATWTGFKSDRKQVLSMYVVRWVAYGALNK